MSKKMHRAWLFSGLSVLALSVMQGPTAHAEAADSGSHVAGLENIIVTARRREESNLSVPAAVSVISSDALRTQQIRETSDIQFLVPGLTEHRNAANGSATVFNIRGQGITSGGTGNPSVVAYKNEIAAGNDVVPVYDLESVQVFKGPQGTLFGATLTGGAVMYTTKRPEMNKFGGDVDVNIGNYGKKEFKGAVNIPLITDKLAARIAGDIDRRAGFTKVINLPPLTLDDRRSESFRISVRFKPIESITNDTIFDYFNSHTNGVANILGAVDLNPASCPPGSIHITCAFGVAAVSAAFNAQLALGPRQEINNPPPTGISLEDWVRSRLRTTTLTNITKYEVSDHFTLRNLFGQLWTKPQGGGTDFDGSPLQGFHTNTSYPVGSGSTTQTSDEFQILGDFPNVVNFIAGGYWQRNGFPASFNMRYFPGLSFLQSIRGSGTKQKALYAQGTLRGEVVGLDRFSLTFGGRKTWANTLGQIGRPAAQGGEVRTSSQAFTYTTSIDYKPSDELLFYVAHRKGFKPGGANTGLILPANAAASYLVYAPETVKDLEIGAKSQFTIGDVQGRANIALYNQWYNNIQRNVVINAATTAISNAKSAKIKGVEFDTSLALTKRLKVAGFFAYTEPKFTNFVQPNFGNGAATTPVTFVDLSSTHFAGVARTSFTLTASYDLPVMPENLGTLTLVGTYFRQSSIYTTDSNIGLPSARDPGYGIGKARLDWRSILGSRFDASLYVNNITDKTYRTGGTAAVFFSQGFTWDTYGDPRTFGIELHYSF